MANKLSIDEKVSAVGMLCEGNSIRSIERMTGIHRDTVMRLGVRMGGGCQALMNEKLRKLDSRLIEVDEVWGFIGMKKRTAHRLNATGAVGDVWTWVALDAETKLVPTFAVGARSSIHGELLHGRFGLSRYPSRSDFQRCAFPIHGSY